MSEAVALWRLAIKDIRRGYIPNLSSIHLLLFDHFVSCPLGSSPHSSRFLYCSHTSYFAFYIFFPHEYSSVTGFFSLSGSPLQLIVYLLFSLLPPLFLSESLSLSSSLKAWPSGSADVQFFLVTFWGAVTLLQRIQLFMVQNLVLIWHSCRILADF